MSFSLGELANLTGSKVYGNEEFKILNVATLHEAKHGDISFVSNPKYIKALSASKASAVILSPKLAEKYPGNVLINKDPYLTFAKVIKLFNPVEGFSGSIHSSASISTKAQIEADVTINENVVIDDFVTIKQGAVIGAGSYIGKNSVIENGVLIHPNVTIYSDTKIGTNSILHSGVVIGADGFGFALQEDKTWYKIFQVGNVEIGRDVEIGANTAIDRAALGSTIIENGVKLDDQIQIGHNAKIGEHTAMAGGSLVAGSTEVGKYCQIGGAVGIAGHITIADDVVITGKSMVTNSIKNPGVYSSGVPTDESKKWRRNVVRFGQLDEMAKTIKELEEKIKKMEEGLK